MQNIINWLAALRLLYLLIAIEGLYMKKFSRTIAMLLVLVMLACSFTSCLSYVYRSDSTPKRILWAVIDIVTLPVSLIALLIYVIINDASGEMEVQQYLAAADYNNLTDYYLLMEKIYALPEAELASLKQALNSIPEAERISSIEKLSSLSEAERFSLINAYYSLPETEIISSVERISSLSEAELTSLLGDFNSSSETELDSMIEELRALSDTNYVATVDSQEKAHTGLSLQYSGF